MADKLLVGALLGVGSAWLLLRRGGIVPARSHNEDHERERRLDAKRGQAEERVQLLAVEQELARERARRRTAEAKVGQGWRDYIVSRKREGAPDHEIAFLVGCSGAFSLESLAVECNFPRPSSLSPYLAIRREKIRAFVILIIITIIHSNPTMPRQRASCGLVSRYTVQQPLGWPPEAQKLHLHA